MKSLPLEVVQTGGGCEAYVYVLPNGWEVVVTDHCDPSLPDARSTCVDVGVYRDEEWLDVFVFQTVAITTKNKTPENLKVVCGVIAWNVAQLVPGFDEMMGHNLPVLGEGRSWIVSFRIRSLKEMTGEEVQKWAQEQAAFLSAQDLSPEISIDSVFEVAAIEQRRGS